MTTNAMDRLRRATGSEIEMIRAQYVFGAGNEVSDSTSDYIANCTSEPVSRVEYDSDFEMEFTVNERINTCALWKYNAPDTKYVVTYKTDFPDKLGLAKFMDIDNDRKKEFVMMFDSAQALIYEIE